MAITIRFERTRELRAALHDAMMSGSWLDVAAWADCRRAGRRRFLRAVVICAWLLPALVMMVRARCVFMPDLECGGWVDDHWGMLLFGALVWAAVAHTAAAVEWWLCEEKYLHEMARRGVDGTAGAPGRADAAPTPS